MPVSKRSREVPLTQRRQKKFRGESGRAAKDLWKENVRAACEEEGQHVYLVELQNQRNALLKHLRTLIKPGKLFYGKNRVMRLALGLDEASECMPNIHRIAEGLQGCRCLLVCQQNHKELKQLLRTQVHAKEFARAGFIATQDVELEEGEEALKDFPHSLEERFRSLGLPTILKDGKIVLLGNYSVAKEGEPLTPEQAQMLVRRLHISELRNEKRQTRHLGRKMADFRVKILAEWHDGSFTLHEKN